MASAKKRVAVTGARLEELEPSGWQKQIVPDEIDLTSDTDCIMGQLHGSYRSEAAEMIKGQMASEQMDGLFIRGMHLALPGSLPFYLPDFIQDFLADMDHAALKREWREFLARPAPIAA